MSLARKLSNIFKRKKSEIMPTRKRGNSACTKKSAILHTHEGKKLRRAKGKRQRAARKLQRSGR